MDRGRNLEALAEEDDEEEMEEEHRDSDGSESSTTDDDAPDEGIKRGEPNKFDILCDGVTNSMALVHTALEELLDMKDEMLKHQLPPTLLIKLATNTGKVFRSISDLNMPVNELLRLVRVYSTPWEEKSAALKKLHEDYEAKQRQLNIAIKRLQLVDAHSKRIAREKRVMNWEKLFAKVMSHKGHGRRWKFLIDTIKQKAKLGLEHVQEFTKQLDESSDEEEEDEMPQLQLKRHDGASPTSTSDKVSRKKSKEAESDQGEEEGEDRMEKEEEGSDAGSDAGGEGAPVTQVPSIKIGEGEDEEDDDDEEVEEESDKRSRSAESAKKVRFAEEIRRSPPKVETKDAEVWTHAPDYDHYLFVRMYCPTNMNQTEVKCSVTLGKHYFKTKRLDEDGKPPSGDLTPEEVKTGRYEEASFLLPPRVPDGVWPGKTPPPRPPRNFQISVNTGPKDSMYAMATIELDDLKALDLKVIDLPPLAGDDDVPKLPDTKPEDDLDSLASDLEIPLPDDEKVEQEAVDRVKDVEPMMFPLYSLDGSSAMHKPCGNLPLILYWGKKAKPPTFNRQCGTHGVTELVFEMTGIDLQTTSKADLHKEMVDDSTSVINFAPDTIDRALSALRLTPEAEPPNPPTSPEQESIPEDIAPEVKEEMITKVEYDKVVEKHSKDMLFLQEEYEKQLQNLMQNLQQMEQNQQAQQQQIQKQQQQIQSQQKELSRRTASPHFQTPGSLGPPRSATKRGPETEEVGKPIIHAPMPPQKPKPRGPRKRQPPQERTWDGVPDEFLDRLQYFEEVSYRHRQDLVDKVKQDIQDDIEKKLAGQHKLSKKEEEMFEALNDVSLPALFMPYHRGTVFNPRAHQYFHPTGSTDLRLSQPPSVFQLPPLHRSSSSVLNLFELSKNFNARGPGWLMDRYIQQQEPIKNSHGMIPQTSVPTSQLRSPPYTPQPTYDMPSTRGGDEPRPRMLETEAEC